MGMDNCCSYNGQWWATVWSRGRVVTSQNLVPAKFNKNLIQSTELSCNSGIL